MNVVAVRVDRAEPDQRDRRAVDDVEARPAGRDRARRAARRRARARAPSTSSRGLRVGIRDAALDRDHLAVAGLRERARADQHVVGQRRPIASKQWPAVSTTVGATSVPVHSAGRRRSSRGNRTAATSGHLPGGALVPPITGVGRRGCAVAGATTVVSERGRRQATAHARRASRRRRRAAVSCVRARAPRQPLGMTCMRALASSATLVAVDRPPCSSSCRRRGAARSHGRQRRSARHLDIERSRTGRGAGPAVPRRRAGRPASSSGSTTSARPRSTGSATARGDGRPMATRCSSSARSRKVYTALLLADAVQRREVELDTPVAELLPPGVTVPMRDKVAITLKHLALHSSGLPRDAAEHRRAGRRARSLRRLRRGRAVRRPDPDRARGRAGHAGSRTRTSAPACSASRSAASSAAATPRRSRPASCAARARGHLRRRARRRWWRAAPPGTQRRSRRPAGRGRSTRSPAPARWSRRRAISSR